MDMADDASDAASTSSHRSHDCGGGDACGHEHYKTDDKAYIRSWQEDPDDPENTWAAFSDAPVSLYDPHYHPARLLWARATSGRASGPRWRPHDHRPRPPYGLGFTPKDIRRLRFVTSPIVPGQSASHSRPLSFGPASSSPGANVIYHHGCINAACWSPDGRRLFTGSDDRLVKVWECKTAEKGWDELFCVATGHGNNVFGVKLQPGAEHNVFTCAADGTVRSFDLEAPLESPPAPTVRHEGPVTVTSNVLHPPAVNGRVVGRHRSIVHGFEFWEGGHQGGGSGASTLFVALEEGVLMRYDLREPGWHGEEVIARRGRGAIKAVAIPDRDNFARGVSPWMLCVGGVDARLDLYDIRRLSSSSSSSSNDGDGSSPRLRSFCPRGLPPCAVPSPLDAEGWNSREEVSVSGLGFSRRRAELLVSYQGDQIYGYRLDGAEEEGDEEEAEGSGSGSGGGGSDDDVTREAWSLGGHLNSQTFLKTVAYFGPNDEYVVSGCDTGHTWIWDRRTGGLAALLATDTSICNGVVPHPSAPMLACYGIDSELKLLEVGGPYFSCFRKPGEAAAAYLADDAREAETALQRGRPEWTREPRRQRRQQNNWIEHHLLPKVFPGAPHSQARPRFIRDAWRFQCHVARVRSGGVGPAQQPVDGEERGGLDAASRRLASMLPDYPSDIEDWVGRPRRLAALYLEAEKAAAATPEEAAAAAEDEQPEDRAQGYALAFKRFREITGALVCLKDRGNAHFKARQYDRAEQCYDQVAAYIPRVKAWLGVPHEEVEKEVKKEQEQRREQRRQQQQQQGGPGAAAAEATAAEAKAVAAAAAATAAAEHEAAAVEGSEAAAKAFVTGLGKELRELAGVSLLNMAACSLAKGEPEVALGHLDMLLTHYQSDHPKALYRKGLALLALKRSEEAVAALATAAEAEPGDVGVKRKLLEAKRVWAAEKKRQARAYSAFFASSDGGGGGGGEG